VIAWTSIACIGIAFIWGDWPPFMSYLVMSMLAIGLIRSD
jgi:hypothetical protein